MSGCLRVGLCGGVLLRRCAFLKGLQILREPTWVGRRSRRDLIVRARQESFGQHQLRKHRQANIVPKSTGIGRALSQEECVQESLDLPRIAARAAREDGADLIAECQLSLELAGLAAKRLEYQFLFQSLTPPRSFEVFTRCFNQLGELRAFADCLTDE